jgi:hypothetical protein
MARGIPGTFWGQNVNIKFCPIDIIHENIFDNIYMVKNMVTLIKIKNKDVFMDKYHKLLIERNIRKFFYCFTINIKYLLLKI